MELVERIKQKCVENNTNIASLERELEFGNGVIRRWNERSPGVYQVLKLAKRLNVSMEWLLTGKESEDLTEEERKLVNKYRSCSIKGKERIQETAEEMMQLYPDLPEGVSASGSGKTGTDN